MKFEGKVRQFFTNKKEYLQARKLGIDMSDSYFLILTSNNEIVERKHYLKNNTGGLKPIEGKDYFPTYTLSELLYKLPEWVDYPYNGTIKYMKDAPFYGFCLYTPNDKEGLRTQEDIDLRIECIHTYPIRSAMHMLLECEKNPKLWYVHDVSKK